MSPGRGKEKSKYISYFDLWDALAQPGCPICTLAERNSFRFLDALLYERVNDVGTRVALRESLGFCNWHAWKALEVCNCALGLGIIYEDLLKRIEERLLKVQDSIPSPSRGPLLLRRFRSRKATLEHPPLRPTYPCPACQHVRLFEKIYLEILLDFIAEGDFEKQFSHSYGICFSHLVETIEGFSLHSNLPLLLKKQRGKFEFLRKEVAEFVRKQDYQYADEPRGREADSWKRALEMIVGKREIFASERDPGKRRNEKPPIRIQPQDCAEQADGLKKEVERLKEVLKQRQQYDRVEKR